MSGGRCRGQAVPSSAACSWAVSTAVRSCVRAFRAGCTARCRLRFRLAGEDHWQALSGTILPRPAHGDQATEDAHVPVAAAAVIPHRPIGLVIADQGRRPARDPLGLPARRARPAPEAAVPDQPIPRRSDRFRSDPPRRGYFARAVLVQAMAFSRGRRQPHRRGSNRGRSIVSAQALGFAPRTRPLHGDRSPMRTGNPASMHLHRALRTGGPSALPAPVRIPAAPTP